MSETYASEYPNVLRLAIKSLSSELSFDIVILLIKEDGLELDELSSEIAYHNHEIENELSSLQKGGIVEKRVGDRIGNKHTGKYKVTDFGSRMLDCISIAGKSDVDHNEIRDMME
jgi:predicted transcriptional regulator